MLLALANHPILVLSDGHGGTITYYYSDSYTWIVGALALVWLICFLVGRHLRARAMRRPPRNQNRRGLKRTARIKRELSSAYLQPGFSRQIHALGVGLLRSGQYCIQVFVADARQELWPGRTAGTLPSHYRGVPLVLVEMRPAGFLSGPDPVGANPFPQGIRARREKLVGGISGANTNLTGQSGTIGYFCTRKSKLRRRREVHLLSNSHVFADLRKASVDHTDLILQPSPGEPGSSRPVATLVNYAALTFDNLKAPNYVDAAIAKLLGPQTHEPLIPMIGTVKGYVRTNELELGEAVRKFGRTTGYTEGRVASICLDIWIRYDRTGQSAFFQDQILLEPSRPQCETFVSKGDSGSLVVDAEQNAIGLIFAGTAVAPKATPDTTLNQPLRVEGFGVANPIGEVLDRLKIDLLV
jgi:hypothetical protein